MKQKSSVFQPKPIFKIYLEQRSIIGFTLYFETTLHQLYPWEMYQTLFHCKRPRHSITNFSGVKDTFSPTRRSLSLQKYRIYPRIGRTFFKEKNVWNLGCGLYAGTRVLRSLICEISWHTQSKQSSWMLNSLIECIVWGQVNPCLRRILLLSAAISVSSFRICLLLNEVQRSLHVKPRRPFDDVHLKPCLFICRTTRKIHRTRHKKKKS